MITPATSKCGFRDRQLTFTEYCYLNWRPFQNFLLVPLMSLLWPESSSGSCMAFHDHSSLRFFSLALLHMPNTLEEYALLVIFLPLKLNPRGNQLTKRKGLFGLTVWEFPVHSFYRPCCFGSMWRQHILEGTHSRSYLPHELGSQEEKRQRLVSCQRHLHYRRQGLIV